MDDSEFESKSIYEPKRGQSFIVGAGVSFTLFYLVSYFIWSVRTGDLTFFLSKVWIEAIIPSLGFFLFGGFVGRIVADLPHPRHAALLSGLIFGVFGALMGTDLITLKIIRSNHAQSQIYVSLIFALMGAIVGGTVVIARRKILKRQIWPRFFLSEMLVGFFLMAVIFALLTMLFRRQEIINYVQGSW